MWRKLTAGQIIADLLIAVGFFAGVFSILGIGQRPPVVAVLLGFSIALALRRFSPALALGVSWVTAVAQMIVRVDPNPSDIAVFAIVYSAAVYGSSLTRWLALVSALAAPGTITVYILLTQGFDSLSMCIAFQYEYCAYYVPDLAARAVGWFVAFAFAFVLAWTVGQLVRTRNRARESRIAELAAEAGMIAEQERTRIARDMHDVVAHSLAVVVAQADGARYAAADDPELVQEALRTIASTARDALADVRVLLGQLREEQGTAPQPSLGDLDRLFEQLRLSGLQLSSRDRGTRLPLGATLQLAVYRIVQESLTNALRHADIDREVLVEFRWMPSGLELAVSSALREAKTRTGIIPVVVTDAGHGIAGMRERAVLCGGWLDARPEGGSFVVTAWLPYVPTTTHSPVPPAPAKDSL